MTTWSGDDVERVLACCVLGLVVLLDPGTGETETAAKCAACDTAFQKVADHKVTMLAACRRELAQAHDLADEAAKHPELGCPHWTRVFKSEHGLSDHIFAKHPGARPDPRGRPKMYDDETDRSTEPELQPIDPTLEPGPGARGAPPAETDAPAWMED